MVKVFLAAALAVSALTLWQAVLPLATFTTADRIAYCHVATGPCYSVVGKPDRPESAAARAARERANAAYLAQNGKGRGE